MKVSAMLKLKLKHNCPTRGTGHLRSWRTATASTFSWMFLLLTCQIQLQLAFGLSTYTTSRKLERRQRHSLQYLRSLGGSSIDDDDTDGKQGENQLPTFKGSLAGSKLHEYILREHKPLGCSVEESLANEPDNAKYVFVADVVKGGYAARAGLREGDVIVQLSGTFDEVVDVAGLGIDKM